MKITSLKFIKARRPDGSFIIKMVAVILMENGATELVDVLVSEDGLLQAMTPEIAKPLAGKMLPAAWINSILKDAGKLAIRHTRPDNDGQTRAYVKFDMRETVSFTSWDSFGETGEEEMFEEEVHQPEMELEDPNPEPKNKK